MDHAAQKLQGLRVRSPKGGTCGEPIPLRPPKYKTEAMTLSEKYRKALILIDRNEAAYNDLVHRFEKLKKAAKEHECDTGQLEHICLGRLMTGKQCTITEALNG